MKILYIFPQPGAPYSRKQIVEQAEAGTLPDTLLTGANRLPQYGIDVDCLFASDYSIAGRPPQLHLQQQFNALRRQDEYDLIVCKDLMTGLFLAPLRKAGVLRTPVVLLDLVLSEDTPFQSVISAVLEGFDTIVCATPQIQTYTVDTLGVPSERVRMQPWAIDTEFWNPDKVDVSTNDQLIISCGSNHRDYETLVDALRPTDYQVEIITQGSIPNEPFVERTTYWPTELRERYAQAKVAIVPLYDVPSASGITVILEAMAMGTPLIVTKSRGIESFLQNEQNALVVPPRSADAIRTALTQLSNQAVSEQLAENAIKYVNSVHSLKIFVDRFIELIQHIGLVGVNESTRGV
jgi:glycosyltransferase involved in cell wall biosynthesis